MIFKKLESSQLDKLMDMYNSSGQVSDGDDWWSDMDRLAIHDQILTALGGGTFVIQKDDRVICHGDVLTTALSQNQRAVYILTLETDSRIRNAGIGTAFFNQLTKYYNSQGIDKIYTSSANESADRFYTRQGLNYYTYHYRCTFKASKPKSKVLFNRLNYGAIDHIEKKTYLLTFPYHPREYLFESMRVGSRYNVDCYGSKVKDIANHLQLFERRDLYFVVWGNEIHIFSANKNILMEEGYFILTNAEALANYMGLATYTIFLGENQYSKVAKLKPHGVIQNINLSNF